MRKKKLPIGKWVISIVAVVIVAGGYWLSLERPAPEQKTDAPVELQLKPLQ